MFDMIYVLDLFRNRSRRRRKPAQYRPAVQPLEDRYLLSTFQEFPLPALPRDPREEFHRERITTGPDGNLWFIDGVFGRATVGRIGPDGSVAEFSIEDNTATQLYNVTAGPDGNLWLTGLRERSGTNDAQVVAIRVTPDGDYTVLPAFPDAFASNISPLVVGSDGNLWYTASFYADFPGTNSGTIVGRITPAGDVTNFNIGLTAVLAQEGVGGGITAGPDGNLWVEIGDGTHGETPGVRRFSLDGQLSDVIPGSRALSEMVTDANGNVWGLVWYNTVERITPDGTVTNFPLPATPQPFDPAELDPLRMTLTAGPDGNIWFSDPYANQIGNITPDGTVTEYAVPTSASFPAGITTGPDGNIWFTELGSGQIGELVLNEGTGGAARPAAPVAPARVFNSAAPVDAPFTGVRLEPVTTTGILTINGFFFQTSSGTLTVKIGGFTSARTDFDQLVFTSGHLDGTLNVILINGYTSTTGDSIEVMMFDSATGTFAALGGDGGLFTATYDPMDVPLTAN
jgi:streptogramin lyase